MIFSAVSPRARTRSFFGLHTLMAVVCGLALMFLALPSGRAMQPTLVARPDVAAQPAGTPAQAKRLAYRREEIEQKKIDNPEPDDEVNIYRHSATVQKLANMLGTSVEVMSRWLEGLNFLVVVAFIVWFLARVMPKALRARTERIQRELQQARTVTEDANRRLASVEERLARLDIEINGIKSQAQQDAVEKEKQMRAALEQEKQSIVDASTQEIAAASSKAQSQLKRMAAELAIERAKHRIAVSAEADRSLVETFLVDLDKHRSGGVN
ncbi:MAG TPA: ATP synthase F0 subunit B [Acidobacteriaceae bacterium]|nr:ATP synthase F0 subunit B [Acidobacteriaceae bacterium]